jgi:hypothetical protein
VPTFYRIVRTDPPTEADFLSFHALGRPLRNPTPETRRMWEGVSVQSTQESARSLTALSPRLGQFIAVMDVAPGGPIRFEQTTRVVTHYTLWGTPAAMLATVRSVVAV